MYSAHGSLSNGCCGKTTCKRRLHFPLVLSMGVYYFASTTLAAAAAKIGKARRVGYQARSQLYGAFSMFDPVV